MKKEIGPLILRISLALVLFWFAYNQLSNPNSWTRVVPEIVLILGLSAKNIVILNGILEMILGALIALGLYTRVVSLLIAIHLYGITMSFGLSPTGVRDFGLGSAALAEFFIGPDRFSLDSRFKESNQA